MEPQNPRPNPNPDPNINLRRYGSLRILAEHATPICCIAMLHDATAKLTLAWAASEDGMVSLWLADESPGEPTNRTDSQKVVDKSGTLGDSEAKELDVRAGTGSGWLGYGYSSPRNPSESTLSRVEQETRQNIVGFGKSVLGAFL